ncbi:MAG: hypothetical protein A3G80_12130 [Betaproteobacteria bacterium RIFCSPLOWO2_12_FULL_62_13b]|nr:MAG: hypothetical protein A3G80_12130 [Betaproteobacteria bacterium RIFCSPLOWO2_12_FULL_62_13b]
MRKSFSQNCLGQEISRRTASLFLAATLAVLAGCGSGSAVPTGPGTGGGSTGGTTTIAQTITGTAATGAPLAGAAVTIQDSAGKTTKGTTAADGTFSIAVTGMTPPFMLVAIPVSGSNLYSVLPAMDMAVANSQNVNITPVTTLVMYELNAGADPATMYTGLTFVTLTAGAVQAKETVVRGKLPANAVNPVFSMMYGKFIAQAGGNDPYDAALDALGKITVISASGVTLTPATGAATTYTSSGGSSSAAGPTLSLKLTDPATGAATTAISSTNPAMLTATVTNGSGAGVPNAIVTFATDPLFGAFSGGSNTALTNASGVASVTLSTPSTSGGASTVTASSSVSGAAVTSSLSYAIGTSNITLSSITLPVGLLSAYGTASVSVNVLNNGVLYTSPTTVKFTSTCAASGKATLTASVTSLNGTASASYLDNGCNNPNPGDSITATLLNGVTATGNLKVNTPNVGSIQFVSVSPSSIALKGTGGTGRSESARVTFKVVDSAGNPFGGPGTVVNFSLNTAQGGLALSSVSASPDPVTGQVVTNVQAGTVSTAVRVTAAITTANGTLSTQSDQLVVSTGIPSQDSFSLGASTHNIEGWSIDGTTTTLTVRMADHFHNPVPDGTAVAFTSEGGVVLPSCTTVGGVCTSTLTSQALRPSNGRVTVLARATGEETFTDLNGDGFVNTLAEMIDANGASTDMGDAFVDYNENGVRDSNEPYFDFNGNGYYTAPKIAAAGDITHPSSGLYRGLLCNGDPAVCSAQKTIDVRNSQVIVFSSSTANIIINGGATIALPTCTPSTGVIDSRTFTVTVVDQNGNAMPAGTLVTFLATAGTITSTRSYTVPDTTGCRIGNGPDGVAYACPAGAGSASFGNISVTMTTNAVFSPSITNADGTTTPATCSIATGSTGIFTVNVTSPSGVVTTNSVGVTE